MAATGPGSPAWLRAHNSRAALDLLLRGEPLSRTRLGELLGLSKPTATQIVAQLESAGYIRRVGEETGGRGPNAAIYGPIVARARGVAIDMREHVIAATVVDAGGTAHPIVEVPTSGLLLGAVERSPESDVRAAVHAACVAADLDDSAVSAVVVGVQAGVSHGGDVLDFTDTLPGWPERGARARLERSLGVDAELVNDVDLAAAAETAVGVARGVARTSLIWLGDGIGSSLVIDGRVLDGSAAGAGEIGYLPVPAAALDLDPTADDLTDLAGGPGIASLLDRHGLGSVAEVLDRAEALDEWAVRLGLALGPVLAVGDPELVVLAGPNAAAGGDALAGAVERHLAATSRWTPRVRTGAVAEPVITGARSVLVRTLRDRLVSSLQPS